MAIISFTQLVYQLYLFVLLFSAFNLKRMTKGKIQLYELTFSGTNGTDTILTVGIGRRGCQRVTS